MANTKNQSLNKQNSKKRIKKPREYKSFRLAKKIKPAENKKIAYSWTLIKQTWSLILKNKKIFFGILAVYVLLTLVFRGFDLSSGFSGVKENVDALVGQDVSKAESAIGLYLYAVASSGSNSGGAAQVYQLFITLIVSLATIWSARQLIAGERIKLRDSFYKSTYPAIPFMLVLFVIGLQFIPLLAGGFLLGTVFENNIAVTAPEKFLWIVVFLVLAVLSFYMIISSVFALYITTLADMTPMRALKSARELVRHRRLGVAIRIIAPAIFLLLLSMLVIIPVIFIASWLVEWVVLIIGGFALVFFNCYLYKLYRELLGDE